MELAPRLALQRRPVSTRRRSNRCDGGATGCSSTRVGWHTWNQQANLEASRESYAIPSGEDIGPKTPRSNITHYQWVPAGVSTLRRVPVKKLSGQMTFRSPPQQTLAEMREESAAHQLGSDQVRTDEPLRKDCQLFAFRRCLQLSLTPPHIRHVQCPLTSSRTHLRD